MKMKHTLAALAAAAIVSASAFAQVGARPQVYSSMVPPDKGTAEIGIAGSVSFGDETAWQIGLRYLPYLNRNLQVGGDLTYAGYGSYDAGFITLRADWNFVPSASDEFATKRTVPYAGAGIGFDFGDSDQDTAYDIHGGLKHFITNDVSVFGELRVRLDNSSDDAALFFGINTYLRR